tara:strand:- start:227 stop:2197 length:1971 start_codon:yes stop_codon:yes gene_type:complete
MALQRTITTPGSYEKPVEGIVDYGAFQRGFDENFNMEDVEKAVAEKKQKFKEKTDKIFKESDLATGSFLDDQGKIILNPSVDTTNNYKNVLLEGKSEYIDRKTTRERKKELEAQALGFNATNETVKYLVSSLNSGDAVSLRGSTVEELFEEQGVTFEEFSESYNNGNFFPSAKKNDKGNIIYGAEVLDKNGQKKFIDLTGKINQTTIADKLAINAEPDVKKAITEYKAKGGKTFNETDLFKSGDTGNEVKRTRLVNQYKDGTYASAESQAKQFVTNKPDLARGLYADATINTDIYTEAEQEFINMGGFKYEGTRGDASNIYYIYAKQIEDDMGLSVSGGNYVITKEDGTTETIDPKSNRGKNITTQVDSKTTAAIKQTKDGISIKYLKNQFLGTVEDFYMQDKNVTFSTSDSEYTNNKSYYDNLFSEEIANGQTAFTLKKGAHYPKKDLYQTTKLAREEDPATAAGARSAVGIVEDLNTQFNAITSDAETEFNKPDYKAGTTRSGEDQAPQMFNFLTNKSYMKGGSEKSIDNVEYRIIGEGKERKILLDIFSVSAGKEDKLATVDLGDAIARRDFLTNIGQGLAVTSSEKQAVREETKALTQSRELAFKVFKGLGVGEKNENKWQQLARALRNNSSEGLNPEEKRIFFDKGYGKQK